MRRSKRQIFQALAATLAAGALFSAAPAQQTGQQTPATPAAPQQPAQPQQPATPTAPQQPATPAPAASPEDDKPALEFPPTVDIERGDKKITAVKYGPEDKGLAIICPANDENKVDSFIYYDVAPYRVKITVNENIIRAPIAFVQKREGGDGHLEAYDGTVKENPNPDLCLPIIQAEPKEGTVLVNQGKTRLTGQKLVYDESNGLAVIDGPITFTRPQKDDALNGTSKRITIDVDKESTFLEGDVVLKSKCRSSSADSVLYDDNKGIAILSGSPAKTSEGDGQNAISGDVIRYNLETNDVVVTSKDGKITGSFSDEPGGCK